jgi:hypothetical protein
VQCERIHHSNPLRVGYLRLPRRSSDSLAVLTALAIISPALRAKIVILHRRRWLSGYLIGRCTLRRLSLSFLEKVLLFSFLGHELSPLMFGPLSQPNVDSSDPFPILTLTRSQNLTQANL